jgi:serine/threonine protein kinase
MSAPEAPAFKLDLDLKVGKYDVQKMLGKGATGTVYLAKDTFTGKEVALKTIEPEVFRDPEFGTVYRSQFLNEASLAGKLRHPYIVNILDAVVGEDSGHIAMELVTGGDLSKYVTSGQAAAGRRRDADRLQVLRCARVRGQARASSTATSSPRTS